MADERADYSIDRIIVRGADCLEWDKKKPCLGSYKSQKEEGTPQQLTQIPSGDEWAKSFLDTHWYEDSSTYELFGTISMVKSIVEYECIGEGRKIGWIRSQNTDGSYEIALLGDNISFGTPNAQRSRMLQIMNCLNMRGHVKLSTFDSEEVIPPNLPSTIHSGHTMTTNGMICEESIWDTIFNDKISDVPMPEWISECGQGFLMECGRYNGHDITSSIFHYNLTTNENLTLLIGVNAYRTYIDGQYPQILDPTPTSIFGDLLSGWYGDMYSWMVGWWGALRQEWIELKNMAPSTIPCLPFRSTTVNMSHNETYAYQYTPFNIILTHDLQQAKNYIANGTLPSDAFLYPFDADMITPPDVTDVDDDEDEPDETDDVPDHIDPTPIVIPSITPAQLSNNNYYWLEASELESFVDWFWHGAGDLLDAGDLWDRVKGLYNDLASAVLSVRYMPIDVSWIGGTVTDAGIHVGQIMKTGTVNVLDRTKKAIVRKLGEFELKKRSTFHRYHSFADYSPYASAKLYLPYHGFIDLDIDLLMGEKLIVYANYDHLAGAIQYFIYRDETMIHSCIAKMAVDLPMTLQSKNDRDSAIFNNLTSATASLIGAGASAMAGSPVGFAMSAMNMVQSGASSAPIKTMGTVGESSAYYAPNKCSIYLQRPRYNRPTDYDTRVGYPFNKGYTLKNLSGYTTVTNPQITFGKTKVGGSVIKPTDSEVETIYEALESGVIL